MPSCLTVCLLASCAFFHPRSHGIDHPAQAGELQPARSPTAALPVEHRVGTVRVIGTGQRFVLIEIPGTGVGSLPDGQMLRCSAMNGATATLRLARERRRPFIVADVVTGEPHVGDAVFTAPLAAAAAGSMVLPTATSGVLPFVLPGDAPTAHAP